MKKFLLILFTTFASSCVLVPVIDSIKKVGLTSGDRKELLPQSVKKFHDLIQWGNINDALLYVDSDNSSEIYDYLQAKIENEKIVESKVKGIKYEDGAFQAIVEIKIRAYKVPVYIVVDKIERQTWKFGLSDSWRLTEITEVKKQ